MDVDRRSNLPEEHMSQRKSLSSNYRNCSQSRKVSIGVLVDSISQAKAKGLKEPVGQIAENETYNKGNCIKDREAHTPIVEKHVTAEQKDTSPWVSTRSFNQKRSSSVAVQDEEHTPSFPATRRRCPKSKLLEKTSAAHSLKFFAAKTGLESDDCRKKISGNDISSVEDGKVNKAEHVENLVCSAEQGIRLENDQVEDKNRTTETGGRETLRMKLWEILGNVSSPNKHCPSPKCVELHPDQEMNGKQSLIEKINLNSDTIESDSQTPVSTRPMTRFLSRRKASTKKQSNKTEVTESIKRKECPQKRIFSFRGDWSGRLFDNVDDGSLPSKRNRTLKMSSRAGTCHGCEFEYAEERMQSEKSRSTLAIEKPTVHRNKASNASSSIDRRNDVLLEPKKSTKNTFEPLNLMTDRKNVQQPIHVEVSKKNQQENISSSTLKNNRNSGHDHRDPPSVSNSHGGTLKSKQGEHQEQSPAENYFNTTGIRSFKCLFSPKSAECEPNVQLEPSDNRCETNVTPNNSSHLKPNALSGEDGENRMSKSSTDETDSERSENEPHRKGCAESEEFSPENFVSENFLHSQNKSLGSVKDVEVAGCSPASDSLKDAIQNKGELEMYLEQNHEDDLARAVALFAVALNRLKTKLKSISTRRSAEILRASVEEIFLRLQNAESLIKTDTGKLTNLSHLKRKQLETRFQEQQEQLLGIYKRFKEGVDQHLQNYGSLIEDLEEHEIELKRSVEKQRASHKKIIMQVEQEINVQLDGTESRIMAVQELAREKMLQLKLGVAECLKNGAFG